MTRMITNEEKILYKDLSYKIIFKLKAIERIADAHRAQTLNYNSCYSWLSKFT